MTQPPMTPEDQSRIGLVAGTAFSPSTPITERDVFAGRVEQVRQVIDAIAQPGQSVLIYGERGVGKTSLANVIDDFYLSVAKQRIFSPHIACDSDDTFATIWTKIVQEKDRARPAVDLSPTTLGDLDNALDDAAGEITPHTIRTLCEIVGQTHLFIPMIDEFDRVSDHTSVRLMTDTIKTLSDHSRTTTVVLVGVGDTIDDLVAEHESVERSLIQVAMGRMAAREAEHILTNSTKVTGITFTDDARKMIISIAQGLPHYVHVLGLNAVRSAVDAGSWTVETAHVEQAIDKTLAGSSQSLKKLYTAATSSPRKDNRFREVLLACVFAERDALGYFAAADVKGPLSRIVREPKRYATFMQHLNKFGEPDRGTMLQKTGEKRRFRYRFRVPLIQPYIIMQGLKDRHITRADIEGLFKMTPSQG